MWPGANCDGVCGFRVSLQAESISSGQCRLNLSNITTVFGGDRVPKADDNPVAVTLTDNSDYTSWPVQLIACGDDQYWLTGLGPWFTHCNAGADDALQLHRRASPPEYLVGLFRDAGADNSAAAVVDAIASEQIIITGGTQPNVLGAALCGSAEHATSSVRPATTTMQTGLGEPDGNALGRRLSSRGWVRLDGRPLEANFGVAAVEVKPEPMAYPLGLHRQHQQLEVQRQQRDENQGHETHVQGASEGALPQADTAVASAGALSPAHAKPGICAQPGKIRCCGSILFSIH